MPRRVRAGHFFTMTTNIIFHDCMPGPEPIPTTGIIDHIASYIAVDRIAAIAGTDWKRVRFTVLAEKNEPLQWLVKSSEEIREWFPGSPILYVAGHLIGFNEDATSIAVLALPDNGKERVEFLCREARRILDESGADITQKVTILPLAKQLMAATDCGIDAAKRRIAEAIRRKRGEYTKAKTGSWGGKREGAGRPPTA